jgi:hypothetical protein
MVSKTTCLIAEMLGFEPSLHHILQNSGPIALSQLAMAVDLWISGSRVQSKVISGSHMALGSLIIGCLAPMALEQCLNDTDAELQINTASFGLFSALAYPLVARMKPEEFDNAAEMAKFRQVPISSAYRHLTGQDIHVVAGSLAKAWALPRLLTIALQGPTDFTLTKTEKLIVGATETATLAAESVAVGIEPWPYIVKSDSIEQLALIQALGMRAKRVSMKLTEKLADIKTA